ncbi:MAG: VOC family protein [Polyangiaceae bacterium]
MTISAATPYLIVGGKSERAIALYQAAFGAEVTRLQRFGDMNQDCPEAEKHRVMHAELAFGGATIMLSDGNAEMPPPGGVVRIALNLDDPDQAKKCFDVLAESGQAIHPLFDAPWGALFGVVQDELGVNWMFNCTKP